MEVNEITCGEFCVIRAVRRKLNKLLHIWEKVYEYFQGDVKTLLQLKRNEHRVSRKLEKEYAAQEATGKRTAFAQHLTEKFRF